MNAKTVPLDEQIYCCPGQQHPISRAVHLGRLAAFYPPCRQCPHGGDTGTLSPRQVEKLQEVQARGRPRSLFHEEGAGGVYLNDLTPAAARQVAAAFAAVMRDSGPNASIILASDGRPLTAEVTAAVGEGLRFGRCDVMDIGPATAACLAFAVQHFNSAGGILVGNPSHEPHLVGLQFWSTGPRPLSGDAGLEAIAQRYQAGVDRPAREYGDLRRAAATAPYLNAIREHYHALRPLRVVIDSASRPLVEYLNELTATVACQVIPNRVARHDLPQQVRADGAHFAVCVDGDGESCRVLDEQGRAVSAERLLLLLARSREADGLNQEPPCVVVEEGASQRMRERLKSAGVRIATCGTRRADMAAAMSQHGACLGGGSAGRFWHRIAGLALPDALMTVTELFVLLSRSDEPFSIVLDRDALLE